MGRKNWQAGGLWLGLMLACNELLAGSLLPVQPVGGSGVQESSGQPQVPAILLSASRQAATAQPRLSDRQSPLNAQGMFELMLGEFALQSGDLPLAAEAWKKAAENTNDPSVLERATKALTQLDRLQEALPLARRWARAAPDQVEPSQYLAALLVGTGQRDEAVRLLQQLTQRFPERMDVYLQLSEILAASRQYEPAVQTLQMLIKKQPQQAAAYYALGHLRIRMGQDDKALVLFRQALERRPEWEQAALAVAMTLSKVQGDRAASDFLQTYIQRNPNAQETRMYLAASLLRQERWDDAYALYQELAALQPENPDVFLVMGMIELQRNDLSRAEQSLNRVMELAPDQPAARYYLGRLEESRDNLPQALAWYEGIGPGALYVEARLRMIQLDAQAGNLKSAHARLADLRKKMPDDLRIQLLQAELAMQEKDAPGALAIIDAAIAKAPRQPDLLYQRAAIYERMRNYAAMEQDIREVIRLQPDNAHAYNFLGYSLVERRERLPEAEILLKKALQLAPRDPYILDSMGWLLHEMGRDQEALDYLQKALLQYPNDPEISVHAGEVLWALGRHDEARKLWRSALQAHPDNAALKERIKR
ncbi:tetratricopeptide repeat protein [Thermithiobacillus plumbiphilus]|uniref:Tetratricopeptide repeat protein n=1 Tax=Thermithiobacillus plumbiphilus TaxID=1729899 RepID=A0ABU9D638_9PROT